jgi:hypothetical protein
MWISNTKKYPTVVTVSKYNRNTVEGCKIDNPNTQIHDQSLSWLSTGTSKKKKRD